MCLYRLNMDTKQTQSYGTIERFGSWEQGLGLRGGVPVLPRVANVKTYKRI